MAMAFVPVLENDLRSLCQEARRKYPPVKEAAERALLKLRSVSDPESLAKSDDVMRTFVIACETKNLKLTVIGLACLQKLIAHDAVAPAALGQILSVLKDSPESFDETVQLKTLQTVLTILQSQLQPVDEDSMATLLGVCLRLLGSSRNSDSVHSTAAATLRQAVALIFDRVLLAEALPSNPRGHHTSRSNSVSGDVSRSIALTKLIDEVINEGGKQAVRDTLTPQGRMGLKLFEDLSSLACGGQATWLAMSPMPRTFSLDMVEYVLSHYVSLFLRLSPFTQVLRQKVCSLLITSLRATGEVEGEVGEPSFRRLLLRTVGSVVRFYSSVITTEVEVFLTMLIRAMDMELPLWYRISVLEILRGFCVEARMLKTIFQIFDMRPKNTNVVADLVACLAKVVSIVQGPVAESGEESLVAVAGIFSSKAQGGVDWHMDFDSMGNLQLPANEAHAIALALEGLLGVVFTIATLTDEAVDSGELDSPHVEETNSELVVPPGGLADICRQMVDSVWVTLLEALSLMLSKSVGEAIVLEVLKGYQAFTQACGVLCLTKPRDAFLGSLCKFTLAHQQEPGKSPADGDGRECATLTAKNIQALRTLFNVAHRLHSVLGPSWSLVLETLAALDRTVHAQDGSLLPRPNRDNSSQFTDLYILSTLDAQLFESSSLMSDSAVQSLLSALRHVCSNSLAGVTTGLGSSAWMSTAGAATSMGGATQAVPKMFSVERMVDIVVHNMQRVDRLWGEVVAHLLELSCHESAQVRMVAMDALDRCITAVLGSGKIVEDAHAGRAREASQHVDDAQNTEVQTSTKLGVVQTSDDQACTDNGCAVKEKSGLSVNASEGSISGTADENVKAVPRVVVENTSELEATDSFECIVILPLSMLYHSGRDVEVRAGALRIVLHALERHGERLFFSWPKILKLLREVADSGEKDLVPLGFQGVTLVLNDCLSALPKRLVKSCVEVAGAYGSQCTDVNISLTAIGLLWTTVDYFGRRKGVVSGGGCPSAVPGVEVEVGRTSPCDGDTTLVTEGERLQDADIKTRDSQPLQQPPLPELDAFSEDMLHTIYCIIKNLGTDERPEVRNSAIRTLFASIVSHGAKISQDLWQLCLWKLLFPLLDTVRHLAATSSRDEWVGKELGKQGGKPVHMLVHHSRNTAQKQWDETLVVALYGMSRLLRSFLPIVHKMNGFRSAWESLLQFFEESVLEGSKEVALAAVNSLFTILQANGLKGTVPKFHWETALGTLNVIARNSAHSDSRVPLKARSELLEGLGSLYKSCYPLFTPKDYLLALSMLDVLIRHPILQGDPSVHTSAVLPQVQRTVLEVLPLMYPQGKQLEIMWPEFLRQLLTYLPGGDGVLCEHLHIAPDRTHPLGDGQSSGGSLMFPANGQDRKAPSQPDMLSERTKSGGSPRRVGTADAAPSALSYGFAERIVALLVDLYISHVTPSARSQVLPDILGGLGRCMAIRRDEPKLALWRTAVGGFEKVLETSLLPDSATGRQGASYEVRPEQQSHGLQHPVHSGSLYVDADVEAGWRLRMWKEVVDLFEGFLVGTCGRAMITQASERISPDQQKADEQLEFLVLDLLCDKVLVSCQDAPMDVIGRLVSVVDQCAGRTSSLPVQSVALLPQHCGRFSLACLRKVFGMCERGSLQDSESSSAIRVAKVALPVLISRCESIFKRFYEDEEQTHLKGMPSIRMEELICLLQELARLVLHPIVAASLDVPVHVQEEKGPLMAGAHPCLSSSARDISMKRHRGGSPSSVAVWGPLASESPRSLSSSPRSGHYQGAHDAQMRIVGRERTHLLLLYTPLCELIVCDDMQVRELMRVLLRLAGGELGLLKNAAS
ncbi:hypothetical protein CBR_g18881 [Chara braunii]|uniref:Protein MON2 homolog n=1 Tax=Chara braunii TaxID=69332 RepID=A0A388KWM5_CHABU|nr:hypothetical protein CBR_g18881 [Chara braunii]|eukprot:GBG74470.1 hypothetical protein CBR_g18881 [Chara braunii]